jgi:linoleoyl-CoA desaturase
MIAPKFAQASKSFHAELNKRIADYFKNSGVAMTGNAKLYTKAAILITGFIALYVHLVFFTPLWYFALAECVILGFFLAGIGFNVMHDGAHGSFSKSTFWNEAAAYTLNVLGGSSFMWKMKHNVVHHTFTNIDDMDDDIEAKPFLRLGPNQKRLKLHRFQHIYFWFFYSLLYIFWILFTDYKKLFSGKVLNTPLKKMKPSDHIVFWSFKVLHYGLFFVMPIILLGFVNWLLGFLTFALTGGLILSIVFQLAHTVEEASFPLPNEHTGNMDDEWAIHQIKTTANFATKNKIITWFVGGLNFQVEHHLFPKVSHIHYPEISKIVKQVCSEFEINYIEFPKMRYAVASHVKYLKQMGRS